MVSFILALCAFGVGWFRSCIAVVSFVFSCGFGVGFGRRGLAVVSFILVLRARSVLGSGACCGGFVCVFSFGFGVGCGGFVYLKRFWVWCCFRARF